MSSHPRIALKRKISRFLIDGGKCGAFLLHPFSAKGLAEWEGADVRSPERTTHSWVVFCIGDRLLPSGAIRPASILLQVVFGGR